MRQPSLLLALLIPALAALPPSLARGQRVETEAETQIPDAPQPLSIFIEGDLVAALPGMKPAVKAIFERASKSGKSMTDREMDMIQRSPQLHLLLSPRVESRSNEEVALAIMSDGIKSRAGNFLAKGDFKLSLRSTAENETLVTLKGLKITGSLLERSPASLPSNILIPKGERRVIGPINLKRFPQPGEPEASVPISAYFIVGASAHRSKSAKTGDAR